MGRSAASIAERVIAAAGKAPLSQGELLTLANGVLDRDRRLTRYEALCERFEAERDEARCPRAFVPRRREPDPLALAVGRRVCELRLQAGLSLDQLAGGGVGKGHLSSLERGLVRPTVHTLQALADRLGVLLVDLVCQPGRSDREHVIDQTRHLSPAALAEVAELARALSTRPGGAP